MIRGYINCLSFILIVGWSQHLKLYVPQLETIHKFPPKARSVYWLLIVYIYVLQPSMYAFGMTRSQKYEQLLNATTNACQLRRKLNKPRDVLHLIEIVS